MTSDMHVMKLTVCSLNVCIMSIRCNFSYFPFRFLGQDLGSPVPGHCLLLIFILTFRRNLFGSGPKDGFIHMEKLRNASSPIFKF